MKKGKDFIATDTGKLVAKLAGLTSACANVHDDERDDYPWHLCPLGWWGAATNETGDQYWHKTPPEISQFHNFFCWDSEPLFIRSGSANDWQNSATEIPARERELNNLADKNNKWHEGDDSYICDDGSFIDEQEWQARREQRIAAGLIREDILIPDDGLTRAARDFDEWNPGTAHTHAYYHKGQDQLIGYNDSAFPRSEGFTKEQWLKRRYELGLIDVGDTDDDEKQDKSDLPSVSVAGGFVYGEYDQVKEVQRLIIENEQLKTGVAESKAAIKTLKILGYTYHGGQLWKPPIGKSPKCKQDNQQEWTGDDFKSQFWVAEVDKYGTHWNIDGPHDSYQAAKDSIPLIKSLNKEKQWAVTETKFRPIQNRQKPDERQKVRNELHEILSFTKSDQRIIDIITDWHVNKINQGINGGDNE